MSHQTLYRKYRPKTFGELKGQDHIVQAFTKALQENKIAHAYLFSGGRGTGKTSVARIIAHELGTADVDIYEIDAASNRGIDEIRSLRESVQTLPFNSRFKVYIIDEAHMLTPQAANALLKTLEEPPAHVIFILATTDKHKLPKTILSRTQQIEFNNATDEVLQNVLQEVAQKEGVHLDIGVSELLTKKGNGSFRDALSFLETALLHEVDNTLTLENLSDIHKSNQDSSTIDFLYYVQQGEQKQALSLAEASLNKVEFLLQVVHSIRDVLYMKLSNDFTSTTNQYSEDELKKIKLLVENKENPITSNTLKEAIISFEGAKKNESLSDAWIISFVASVTK